MKSHRDPETTWETIKVLKELIKENGLTQAKIADRLDMTQGYLSQILAGQHEASVTLLGRIAATIGYDVIISFEKR